MWCEGPELSTCQDAALSNAPRRADWARCTLHRPAPTPQVGPDPRVLGHFQFAGERRQPGARMPFWIHHRSGVAPQLQRPSGRPNQGQRVPSSWFRVVHDEGPGPGQRLQRVDPTVCPAPGAEAGIVDHQIGPLNRMLGHAVHPGADVKGVSRVVQLARRFSSLVHPTDDNVGLAPPRCAACAQEPPCTSEETAHQLAEFHGKRVAKASGTNGRMSPPWLSTSRTTVEWIAVKAGSVKSTTVSKSGCIWRVIWAMVFS